MLSTAQKRFNSLLRKITRQRAELQAWDEKTIVFARTWMKHVVPFRALQAGKVVEIIDLLDDMADQPRFSELDRATLEAELCDMIETVLAEGVLEPDECQRLEALFDCYSGVSLEELRAGEEADFKAQVLDEVGLDLGDEAVDLNDPGLLLEQVLRKLEEQHWEEAVPVTGAGPDGGWSCLLSDDAGDVGVPDAGGPPASAPLPASDPAAKAARRAERRRMAAAERRRLAEESAQQRASESVQVIFRQLASLLHPDREKDPAERARKTRLMQRATTAYQDRRLLDLLELQLEVAQRGMGDLTVLSDARLETYNRLLKAQGEALAREIQQREMWLRATYPLNRIEKSIKPRDFSRILREIRAGIRMKLLYLEQLKVQLATVQGTRTWLKSLRQQAAREMRVREDLASLMAGILENPPGRWQ